MANHNGQSSADIEREVEAQRAQVESTIGEIKDRLTPGQLVDEIMSYTKHGGAHFASNLGQTLTANPLPAALLGVSLAWLIMGGQKNQPQGNGHDAEWHRRAWNADHGYMAIRGASLQRIRHARGDDGFWYSEFTDDGGAKYRARSDEKGHRLGHFMDEAGKAYAGFFDEAGNRIAEFRDEAGTAIEEAAGWANHAWQDAASALGQHADRLASSANHLAGSAVRFGGDMSNNAARMSRDAMRVLEEQPLVMGALAFAAGAALGAVVPHTKQEDELLGELADDVKGEAGHIASDLYAKGKEKAGELYEEVSDKAGEIYDDAKKKLTDEASASGQRIIRH
jgi:hypothetical protein